MPYVSHQQRKWFNVNRARLEAAGVDVEHWNKESKGKKLPKKAPKSDDKKEEKKTAAYSPVTLDNLSQAIRQQRAKDFARGYYDRVGLDPFNRHRTNTIAAGTSAISVLAAGLLNRLAKTGINLQKASDAGSNVGNTIGEIYGNLLQGNPVGLSKTLNDLGVPLTSNPAMFLKLHE